MNTPDRLAIIALCVALAVAVVRGAQAATPLASTPVTTAVTVPASVITPLGATVTAGNGQSTERLQVDDAQCQNAATVATGYIPGAHAAQTEPHELQVGGRARGAAKGAAIGAVAGEVQVRQYGRVPDAVQDEYRGNKAATGAAAGAAVGGVNQRQDRRQSKAEATKAADAEAQKATAWRDSYAGCLQSRGYSLSWGAAPQP